MSSPTASAELTKVAEDAIIRVPKLRFTAYFHGIFSGRRATAAYTLEKIFIYLRRNSQNQEYVYARFSTSLMGNGARGKSAYYRQKIALRRSK